MLSSGESQTDGMSKLNAVMSTPAYLRSAIRGALRAMRMPSLVSGGKLTSRIGLVALLAIQAAACSDVTAPGRRMDRDAVENVMPAVNDARRRVASGIADVAVRQQLTITLSNIEIALRADDVADVEKGVTEVQALMSSYSPRAYADRQEISAVMLALAGVQKVSSPAGMTVLASP
jgi:hypothetical protein